MKFKCLKKNSPFTPLLCEFLLQKDIEDEGVGHQSSKKEEDASCNCEQYWLEIKLKRWNEKILGWMYEYMIAKDWGGEERSPQSLEDVIAWSNK